MVKKYAKENIYDENGALLVTKGKKVSEKDLHRLRKLGLEKAIVDLLSESQPKLKTAKNCNEHSLENLVDQLLLKVSCCGSENLNYCSNTLSELLFKREAIWHRGVIGLVNYVAWVYTHSINVALLSLIIGKEMGLGKDQMQTLGLSAFFHDIGYLLIPKPILLSTNELNQNERLLVMQHCDLGKAILKGFFEDKTCVDVALQHHERLDGNGYPNALQEKDINFYAKIVMIADTFDTITSKRPYKPAMDIEAAIDLLKKENKKYDRDLLTLFFGII